MSVVVVGMDIPSDCLKCKFCVESGECAALDPGTFVCDYKDKRPEFCPLRPLEQKDDSTINLCPWCNDTKLDWVIYDKQIESVVSNKIINYCFRCGRKLK